MYLNRIRLLWAFRLRFESRWYCHCPRIFSELASQKWRMRSGSSPSRQDTVANSLTPCKSTNTTGVLIFRTVSPNRNKTVDFIAASGLVGSCEIKFLTNVFSALETSKRTTLCSNFAGFVAARHAMSLCMSTVCMVALLTPFRSTRSPSKNLITSIYIHPNGAYH